MLFAVHVCLVFTRRMYIFFFVRFYLFIFKERGRAGDMERNINVWLPLACPQLGTWPSTQACAVTGNWTYNSLVHRLALNPLNHISQGYIFYNNNKTLSITVHSLLLDSTDNIYLEIFNAHSQIRLFCSFVLWLLVLAAGLAN